VATTGGCGAAMGASAARELGGAGRREEIGGGGGVEAGGGRAEISVPPTPRARFAPSTPTSSGRGAPDGDAPKFFCGSAPDGGSVPHSFSP
jgi:hypothetical protein